MTSETQFPDGVRIDWPFNKMDIGEIVTIKDHKLIGRGQIYAHLYGRSSGKKFKTKKVDDILYVKRLS